MNTICPVTLELHKTLNRKALEHHAAMRGVFHFYGSFSGYLCNSLVSSAKKALWITFPYGKINLLSEVTYMKKKSFPLLVLSLPLILCGCGNQPAPSSSSGSETSSSSSSASRPSTAKEVSATQVYHFGETFGEDEITDTWVYDDAWFFGDSSKINYNLAVMSAMVDGASSSNKKDETGTKIAGLLGQMGFSNIQKNKYYSEGIFLDDSMGAIMGKKKLVDPSGKEYTLLALFTRNAGYENEWTGNFNVGESGLHAGFKHARDEVLRFMKNYIDVNKVTGNVKIWGAGYSRGAATMNLVGGFLGESTNYFGNGITYAPKDIYVYTIGTPRAIPTEISKVSALSVEAARGEGYSDTAGEVFTYTGEGQINPLDEKYNYIHNFTAVGDYVTKMPPQTWGYTRYGKTENIVYGEEGMREALKKYSVETAEEFVDKNYATEISKKGFDFKTLSIVDLNEKQTPDAMIEERIGNLLSIAGSRQAFTEQGYDKILGAAGSIIGIDLQGFIDVIKGNAATLIKAGALNYFAHVAEATEASDAEAIATVVAAIMGKTGEDAKNYTDQQFLADLLDYIVNDYQSKPEGKKRIDVILGLIPDLFGKLIKDLLEYAKTKEMAPKTFDDLLLLLSSFITDNREDPVISGLIDMLVALIPEKYSQYIGYLALFLQKSYDDTTLYPDINSKNKAIILDTLEAFVIGIFNEEGKQTTPAYGFRCGMINLLVGMLGEVPNLLNLLMNGAMDVDGNVVTKEPVALSVLVEDILKLAMPKDEEGVISTIKAEADKALVELLEKARNESIGRYIDIIEAEPAKLRKALAAALFGKSEAYDFTTEVNNAVDFITAMKFVAPSHYHELYVSYLKSKVVA